MVLNTWYVMLALVTVVGSHITTDHEDICNHLQYQSLFQRTVLTWYVMLALVTVVVTSPLTMMTLFYHLHYLPLFQTMSLNTWHVMLALIIVVSGQVTTDHEDTSLSQVIDAISQLNERMINMEDAINLLVNKHQKEEQDPVKETCKQDDECDRGWTKLGGSCYIIPLVTKDWQSASEYCRQSLDSQLVIIQDLEELNGLREEYGDRYGNLWVGAQRRADGQIYWEDCIRAQDGSESCQYTIVREDLWNDGQPHNAGNEDFLEMRWGAGANWIGFLNDYVDAVQHFICEYSLQVQ